MVLATRIDARLGVPRSWSGASQTLHRRKQTSPAAFQIVVASIKRFSHHAKIDKKVGQHVPASSSLLRPVFCAICPSFACTSSIKLFSSEYVKD
jgi:hypothetical protein